MDSVGVGAADGGLDVERVDMNMVAAVESVMELRAVPHLYPLHHQIRAPEKPHSLSNKQLTENFNDRVKKDSNSNTFNNLIN